MNSSPSYTVLRWPAATQLHIRRFCRLLAAALVGVSFGAITACSESDHVIGTGSTSRSAPSSAAAATNAATIAVSTSPTPPVGAALTTSTLGPLLSFTPYLYSSLPAGHQVDAILPDPPSQASAGPIAAGSVNSFSIIISGAAGEYSIEINEGLVSSSPSAPNYIDNPRNPLIAFKSELTPVTLANGQWYEMQLPQGQNLAFAGAWDLFAQRGDVQVEVGGFDSKAILEQFAGSFSFASAS